MLVGPVRPVGLVAVAETAEIRRDQREAGGEPRHHRLPGQPEFRPAMQQQQRLALACPRHMEVGSIGAYLLMLDHRRSPPKDFTRGFIIPRLVWAAFLAYTAADHGRISPILAP